ncbi:UNVERIFIED_CONTAM: hypothetical protein HHA_462600 [Hammondia hammondi]|eukprot:XP_008887661.1 hypothetical protein HHA_462600 [Hammondia hammondi]
MTEGRREKKLKLREESDKSPREDEEKLFVEARKAEKQEFGDSDEAGIEDGTWIGSEAFNGFLTVCACVCCVNFLPRGFAVFFLSLPTNWRDLSNTTRGGCE